MTEKQISYQEGFKKATGELTHTDGVKREESWIEKLEGILFVGFGAFGISAGMTNGYTTDHMIAIRDKTIKDSVKLFSKTLQEERQRVVEEIEKLKKDFMWENGDCSICGFSSIVEDESHGCGYWNWALEEVLAKYKTDER